MSSTTDIERPEWLDESFVAQVYANEQPPPASVEILKCGSVVGVGDNYLSKMYRLTVKVIAVDGGTREDSLVVKSLESTDKTMKDYGIFKIESEMYGTVLKAFEGYWREKGHNVQFGPKCFISVSQPFEAMVFSDLKVEGYAMADRFERLDMEHALSTLSKLSKLHAAGVCYTEREGSPPKVAQRKYIEKNFGGMLAHMLPANLVALDKKLRELGMDVYADKIAKWETSLLPTVVRATDPDYYPGDFHTVLHGDLWLNNELFKYDEQKKPQDVKFVDFQLSYYGNPMFDFLYFVFTSVKPELVVENLDHLLAYYYSELVEAMRVLDVKTAAPSLDQLNVQLQRAGPFVCTLLLDIIPIIIMDRIELENTNSLMTSDDPDILAKMNFHKFNNTRFETVLKTYLPFWDKRGFLGTQLTSDDLPDELKDLLNKKQPVSIASQVAIATEPEAPKSSELARPVPAPRANSNELQLPSWLNAEFVETFRPASDVQITDCSSVVEVGDNYVAKMYRLDVAIKENGVEKSDSFIIKSLENLNPLMKDFGIYETEKELYVDVLPEFSKIWSDIGKPIIFGPKCLKATEQPHDILVLEDLNKSGYKMANRFNKLDLEHALLTLSKLAKFHATSVVFKEKIGYGKQLSRTLFEEKLVAQYHPLMNAKVAHVISAVKSLGFGPEIIEKCEKWLEADPMDICRLTAPSGSFATIAHGDCWMNNILYKYNENGQVEDLLFIDFQMTHYGNPITDIFYFLFSSLRAPLLVDNFDSLIKHYFDQLTEACQSLGIAAKAPSNDQFYEQLRNCAHYSWMTLPEIVPAVVMERHADANIEAFLGDPESEAAKNLAEKMFGNQSYLEILKHVIPFMYQRGFMAPYEKPQEIQDVPIQSTDVNETKATHDNIVVQEDTDIIVTAAAVLVNGESKPSQEEHINVMPAVVVEEKSAEPSNNSANSGEETQKVIKIVPAAAVEQIEGQSTSPTVLVEPWGQPEAKPKRLMKARIEETINKFAALEANGHSKLKPETKPTETPAGYPKWLDKFYFMDLLRKDYSTFKIFKFSVGPATGKGDNYASLIFRVKLSIEANNSGLVNRSFIVKVNHDSGLAAEMMKEVNFFPKEIEMYNSILPKFESMYRNVGEKVKLGARCVLGTQDPGDVIILEDLSVESYKSGDRINGLDMDHVELAISKLAKLHAASAVYVEKGGKFNEHFNEGMYDPKLLPIFEGMFQSNITTMKSVTKDWTCAKTLSKILENWSEVIFKNMLTAIKKDDSRFNVLCHGDLWVNNIMFKYSSGGKVEDALMVDYQICNYNSPTLDLHYFLMTSMKKDLRIRKIDYIISFYHRKLTENLKLLGYQKNIPTLLQLQKDFLATGLFGFSTAIGSVPIVIAPPSDDADLQTLVSDSQAAMKFKEKIYGNINYREAMEELVPYYERKGYFELY